MSDLTARLAQCYSGAVFDALRERGISDTVLPRDIRPLDPGKVMAGPAYTVAGSPKSVSEDDSLLAWTGLLSAAPSGHVVVCAGNEDDRSLMGELSAETLHARGVAGFVTDGGCRDSGFIIELGFPVFSRFYTPRDIVGAWTPDSFGEPVDLGGVTVATGDYVIGDIDGIVVIPAAIAADVVAEVEAVMQTENQVRKAILDGVDPQEAYRRFGRF